MERLRRGEAESSNLEATFEVILEIFKDVSHVEWELLALGYMVLTDLVASPVRKAKILQHRNLRHNFGFVREQRAAATKHGSRELRVTTNNDI